MWNSTLKMLKRFVANKTALVLALAVFQSEPNNAHAQAITVLSSEEWKTWTQ